ncbi:MAG TPA: hypothetical protein VKV33_06790 [Streptosporangiaceae bacterium]|nr:hypothetical protein [Streptosporangiaceae bacterium]
MTSQPEPPPAADPVATLAAQLASLRGQVRALFARLDDAGITGETNLAAELRDLAEHVTQALDTRPNGPAAPCWTGLSPEDRAARLAELRQWADTVLRREYGGYPLPECWANHPHAIWELSTLAAEWHRTYNRPRPDLSRALEFYDRWLPRTMRRIADITQRCKPECITRQRTPKPVYGTHPVQRQASAPPRS